MKRSDERTVAGRILDKRPEQPSCASLELQLELRREEKGRWARFTAAAAVFTVLFLFLPAAGLLLHAVVCDG